MLLVSEIDEIARGYLGRVRKHKLSLLQEEVDVFALQLKGRAE